MWNRWLNGNGPINPTEGVLSLSDAYHAYLDKHEPLVELQKGQLLDSMYKRPYWADVADKRYNQSFNDTLLKLTNENIKAGNLKAIPTTDQQHVNGRLALSANHSYSGAISSLTCSHFLASVLVNFCRFVTHHFLGRFWGALWMN